MITLLWGLLSVIPNSLDVDINGERHSFDLIINTAPLDDLYNHCEGELKYVGRKVEFVILPVEYALPKSVYFSYYTGDEDYTRVVEYKKFTQFQSPNTLISLEYPNLTNGKYYPCQPNIIDHYIKNICHYVIQISSIWWLSRYNYRYDIDDAIEQA